MTTAEKPPMTPILSSTACICEPIVERRGSASVERANT